MNAVEAVKAKIRQIKKNKGNVRLFFLAYVVWVAATAWMLWQPFPEPSDGLFGSQVVAACSNEVLDHDKCVGQPTADIATAFRVVFVFFAPLILPILLAFLALMGATIFQWVSDGYH